VVLTNGRLPLNILEKQVDNWITSKLNWHAFCCYQDCLQNLMGIGFFKIL